MRIAGNDVVMFSNTNRLVNTIFGIYAVELLTPDRSGSRAIHIVAGIGRSPCVEPCYHIHLNDNDYRFFGMIRDEKNDVRSGRQRRDAAKCVEGL